MVDCVGAGLLALSLPMIALAVRERDVRRTDDQMTPTADISVPLVRVPYVRWLALATLCSVIVTGLLDYQFKVVVQQVYPDAAQLASFFGRFYIAINVFALLLQLLATPWLLQRLGAGSAAAVLPIGLAVAAGATLAVPGFAMVVAARAWDQAFRFSLNKSAVELLFFPLHPGIKRRAKAVIEAGIERVGDALAGILILGAGLILGHVLHTVSLDTDRGRRVAACLCSFAEWLFTRTRPQPWAAHPSAGSGTRVPARAGHSQRDGADA